MPAVRGLALFDALPDGLLDRLLTAYGLDSADLTALHTTVCRQHAPLTAAIEHAARVLLLAHPHGRAVAAAPLPNESSLSALRFVSQLDHAAAPFRTTAVWSCGRNDQGQGARLAGADTNRLQPTTRVPADSLGFFGPPASVIAVAAGFAHSVCLSALGAPFVAGANARGQLGLPDPRPAPSWTPLPGLADTRVAQLACGHEHTVLLTADGAVLVSGANHRGQLATGDTCDRHAFERVVAGGVTMVSAGRAHTVLLHADGSVSAAGDNTAGQLASRRDGAAAVSKFARVGCFGRRVVRVACGSNSTMMLTVDNMVLVTGKRHAALSVIGGLGLSRVTHLSVADAFAVVRTDERDVAISRHRKRFIVSDELLHVAGSAVAAGVAHYAIVADDGSALAAGSNAFGQVAAGEMGLTFAGSANARLVRSHQVALSAVEIPDGYRALQVAAGAFHTLYLLGKVE